MRQARNVFLIVVWVCVTAAVVSADDLQGAIYFDADANSISLYEQDFSGPDQGVDGVDVILFGHTNYAESVTAGGGGFEFSDVGPGRYLLHLDVGGTHECVTNNRSLRLPFAVVEGDVKVVAFGDSNGVVGSDVPYPQHVTNYLGDFADAELDNQSIAGSLAREWVPGAPEGYFDDNLLPAIADADVITFTLGGNDLLDHFGDPPFELADLLLALATFPPVFNEIKGDIEEIAAAVHAANPDADLVYLVYPVFANSELWAEVNGEDLIPMVRQLMTTIFGNMRVEFSDIPYLILADIMGSVSPEVMIDEFLYDDIHPNDAGHIWYANEVFKSLGGIIAGEEKATLERSFGFDAAALTPGESLDPGDYEPPGAIGDDDDTTGDDDDTAGDDDASDDDATGDDDDADGDDDDDTDGGCG
ncbi:MAG: SGNH/GDSL hydrolase family protein [Candidatus Lernaella stagnicola]|nr:SGNH/GDSL hydrolase family protein [Candidatus Lernaella stagnicola]